MSYEPPADGNFYELPDIKTILADIRRSGCDVRQFLQNNIAQEHRREVLTRIIEQLNKNEELLKEFEDMRAASRAAALIEVEDNLLAMCRPGGKDVFKATQMALTTLSDRWKKKEGPTKSAAEQLADELEADT